MKVAVVTGGARGIGKAISRRLLEQGFFVVILDVLEEQLQSAVKDLGDNIDGFVCDITKPESVSEASSKIIDKYGRVDCLVNNAGITRDGLLMRMKDDDWNRVMDVNLNGTFNVTRALLRYLIKSPSGSIINISSVVGVEGNGGQVNYSTSKAGLLGFTKSLAREYGRKGLRVNAVAPGFIETEMTGILTDEVRADFMQQIPLNRPGTPRDVALVVGFLASPESSYITGQVLRVDGGMVTA